LRNLQHYDAAAVMARKSVAASGGNPYCLSNLGVSLLSQKKFFESRLILEKVTRLLPSSAPSWHNYGLVLYMMGSFEDALFAFDRAIALGSPDPHLRSDRALALLALGDIPFGLETYEIRWQILAKNRIWNLNIPEWKGETLATGQNLLIHHEQGFGDSLMLSRFLPRAKQKIAANLIYAVPDELLDLFNHSFPQITVVSTSDSCLGQELGFDYHIPMLSLLRYLGIDVPDDVRSLPYLSAPADVRNVRGRLPQSDFKVGICWASGNHGKSLSDRRRVVDLKDFLPLLELNNTTVVSLQKDPEVKEIERLGLGGIIFDVNPWLDDFGVTANVISELDAVISVDSAVAHLAGALGIPCFMLSPYSRCWRWWKAETDGNAEPWYKNMPLFSQASNGSWTDAVADAIASVRALALKSGVNLSQTLELV